MRSPIGCSGPGIAASGRPGSSSAAASAEPVRRGIAAVSNPQLSRASAVSEHATSTAMARCGGMMAVAASDSPANATR
ncbi:hypothetical protein [Saccharopolyspora elongata]|uniref:Uncharacterized protein n=1 Tax=Saccharopolyspora elongata TaxID=2530387 RepID=A0A4R4YUX3_9PSEU|nr:hypothetical protein [Saccharopolyspora elongata]TDD49195.1 hypothetical protein E1288_20075 [Saccharopolyspora elongata]